MNWKDFFLAPYLDRPELLIGLEGIALIFGIWSVWLAKKAHIGVYPTGIIATTLTMYLFYTDRLLGDMLMNAYYSIMSVYGWWEWTRRKDGTKLRVISKMNRVERQMAIGLGILTIVVTYSVYSLTGTQIQVSNILDIFTSGLFFTAMWLMARKKLESWTLWITADVITVPLYAYRGWGMLSFQYLIFTILAIQGYLAWKRSLNS